MKKSEDENKGLTCSHTMFKNTTYFSLLPLELCSHIKNFVPHKRLALEAAKAVQGKKFRFVYCEKCGEPHSYSENCQEWENKLKLLRMACVEWFVGNPLQGFGFTHESKILNVLVCGRIKKYVYVVDCDLLNAETELSKVPLKLEERINEFFVHIECTRSPNEYNNLFQGRLNRADLSVDKVLKFSRPCETGHLFDTRPTVYVN